VLQNVLQFVALECALRCYLIVGTKNITKVCTCVAVCCSVLHSALQYVALECALRCYVVADTRNVTKDLYVCCNVLQCVA